MRLPALRPITLRRILLVALVILAALPLITGCASVDRQCDMRADYAQSPVPTHGEVTLAWAFGQQFSPTVYGSAYVMTDRAIVSLRDHPTFNDTCSLARLGHEVLHAFGGRH